MAKKLLVEFKDYEGYKNVKFIMDEKDYPFRKSLDADNLERLGEVDVKKNEFNFDSQKWQVFNDWSVRVKSDTL